MYYTYTFAEDSPFLHKLNWIFVRMAGGGFVKLIKDRQKYRFIKSQVIRESEKSLTIDDLSIICSTLSVG